MKIVCISDTHCLRPMVPKCDLLIHAGDLTNTGNLAEVEEELHWLAGQKAQRIILVPGNHDFLFEQLRQESLMMAREKGIEILMDAGTTCHGLNIYGSPWQPWFCDWAFNAPQDSIEGSLFLDSVWSRIPDDTDILVTHCPPAGGPGIMSGRDIGCPRLSTRIGKMPNLKLHVCGHYHGGHGVWPGKHLTVNAAVCDNRYALKNAPIVVNL